MSSLVLYLCRSSVGYQIKSGRQQGTYINAYQTLSGTRLCHRLLPICFFTSDLTNSNNSNDRKQEPKEFWLTRRAGLSIWYPIFNRRPALLVGIHVSPLFDIGYQIKSNINGNCYSIHTLNVCAYQMDVNYHVSFVWKEGTRSCQKVRTTFTCVNVQLCCIEKCTLYEQNISVLWLVKNCFSLDFQICTKTFGKKTVQPSYMA